MAKRKPKRSKRDMHRLEAKIELPALHGRPVGASPATAPIPTRSMPSLQEVVKKSAQVFATVIGVIAALVTFLPRVTVSHADPVDPTNPLSVTFTITNSSPAPLKLSDVSARLVLNFVTEPLKLHRPKSMARGPGSLTRTEWEHRELQPDESFTVTPELLFAISPGAKFADGDVAVVVSYHPWPVPITREVAFRFTTQHHENGSITWYSVPME